VLLSFLIHALAVGGALKYVERFKQTFSPPAASGSGRVMVDIVRQGANERLSASPRIQASRRIVTRPSKAAASELPLKQSPLVAATAPVIEREQPQAAAPQPVEGLALTQSTGLDTPGRRRLFVQPSLGPVGNRSLLDDRQRWELDRQLAQEVLLRQQLLHQYLGQWMAQLRPVVNEVADFVCQVGPEIICEPTLPPEVQALVEQGMAQIHAINPASGPYRLVKTNGALSILSLDQVTS
jgi:hypothetical protein